MYCVKVTAASTRGRNITQLRVNRDPRPFSSMHLFSHIFPRVPDADRAASAANTNQCALRENAPYMLMQIVSVATRKTAHAIKGQKGYESGGCERVAGWRDSGRGLQSRCDFWKAVQGLVIYRKPSPARWCHECLKIVDLGGATVSLGLVWKLTHSFRQTACRSLQEWWTSSSGTALG